MECARKGGVRRSPVAGHFLPGGRCFILSCRIQEKGYFCKHDNLEYVKYLLNDKVEYVHHRLKTYDQRDRGHRNGTESRKTLPLWIRSRKEIPLRDYAAEVTANREHRNGTKSRETLPLWTRSRRKIPLRGYAAGVTANRECRNGTKSRKTLPLWTRSRRKIPLRGYTAGVTAKRGHHNGTESRKTLPLRIRS